MTKECGGYLKVIVKVKLMEVTGEAREIKELRACFRRGDIICASASARWISNTKLSRVKDFAGPCDCIKDPDRHRPEEKTSIVKTPRFSHNMVVRSV